MATVVVAITKQELTRRLVANNPLPVLLQRPPDEVRETPRGIHYWRLSFSWPPSPWDNPKEAQEVVTFLEQNTAGTAVAAILLSSNWAAPQEYGDPYWFGMEARQTIVID